MQVERMADRRRNGNNEELSGAAELPQADSQGRDRQAVPDVREMSTAPSKR